jgi:formate hydrogenlyase transcriptional activator
MAHCESSVSWQEEWMERNVSMNDYRSETGFQEIVGDTPALRKALQLTMKVARSEVPVLIVGEAGSGKETFARAIHRISARKNESFVKANCTATAEEKVTSQLFGRDQDPDNKRGSIGLLETAHHGILFLDEIGHVSLEVQAALLRSIERGEFERPGGHGRIPVNVRVIAATTYDLAERVAAQAFLSDLYDRLNLFPLQIPPLRDRRDDIPLLARYFMQRFARRANKHIESIPSQTVSFLMSFDWPGNVSQLENLIERSVALTKGSALQVPLADLERESEENIG